MSMTEVPLKIFHIYYIDGNMKPARKEMKIRALNAQGAWRELEKQKGMWRSDEVEVMWIPITAVLAVIEVII